MLGVELVKTYWKLIVAGLIALTIIGLSTTVYIEDLRIEKLQSMVAEREKQISILSNDIKTQNDAILANKADSVVKTEQLPAQLTKIVTKYRTIYKTMDSITEDKNATCEDMVSKLNNTDL